MRIGLDLDGTLISCKEKHCALMKSLARAFGINFDIDKYWEAKQNGKNNIAALEMQNIDKETAELLNTQWVAQIENIEWLYFDRVFDGVGQALDSLLEKKHTLHLVSARNNPQLGMLQLKQLNIHNYFNTIDFIQISKGQNKKDTFKKLELDMYIGDTEYDYMSSVEANTECFLVESGMRNKQHLLKFSTNVYSNFYSIV